MFCILKLVKVYIVLLKITELIQFLICLLMWKWTEMLNPFPCIWYFYSIAIKVDASQSAPLIAQKGNKNYSPEKLDLTANEQWL